MILKMNKRGVDLKHAFFSVIVVSAVIISFTIWLGGWEVKYGTDIDADLDEFDRLESVSGDIQSQTGRLSADDPDPGQDAEASTFRGVYGILTNIFEPFNVVFGEDGMLQSVQDRYGLPSYLREMVVAMMLVAITFTLIAIIFRLGKS